MKKKVLILTNEKAGIGKIRILLYRIIKRMSEAGYECTVRPVSSVEPGHLIEAEDDYDRVAVCGGDGTLRHLVEALLRNKKDWPVAYFPMGTTNDLSKNIGIGKTIDEQCDAAVSDRTFAYDIGCFNDTVFDYIAAFGAFSDVSYSTEQVHKNAFGYAAYVTNALSEFPTELRREHHLTIDMDGKRIEGNYIFGSVTNSLSVAGMRIDEFSKSSLQDGKLDLLLVKAPEKFTDLTAISRSLLKGDVHNPNIELYQFENCTIHVSEELDWTLDGEYGGKSDHAQFSIRPSAIHFLVEED